MSRFLCFLERVGGREVSEILDTNMTFVRPQRQKNRSPHELCGNICYCSWLPNKVASISIKMCKPQVCKFRTLIPLSLLFWISLLFSFCDFPCFLGAFLLSFPRIWGLPWPKRKENRKRTKARKSKKGKERG